MQTKRFTRLLVGYVPGVLLLLQTFIAASAFAQGHPRFLPTVPLAELKQVYLACDQAASRQLLDMETAAHCSFVGEALQKRAFEGNFDLLLVWWRTEKLNTSGAATDSAPTQTSPELDALSESAGVVRP
jgi:uncharacterized YccA/Bax inhibitor family protein